MNAPDVADRMLTVSDVARKTRVARRTVHAWIRRGELVAFNLSAMVESRNTFRIAPADLNAFFQTRSAAAAPPRRIRKPYPHYV